MICEGTFCKRVVCERKHEICLQQSVNSKEQGKLFRVRLGERGRHGKIKSNNEEIQSFCEKNGHSSKIFGVISKVIDWGFQIKQLRNTKPP